MNKQNHIINILTRLILLFFLCIAVAGCKDDDEVEATLSLDEPEMIVQPQAGVAKITVRSNTKWKIEAPQDEWYSINIGQGDEDGMFKITYKENTTDNLRSFDVSITTQDGKENKKFSFKQLSRNLFISLANPSLGIKSKAGNSKVNVTTNVPYNSFVFGVNYEITSAEEWLLNMKIEDGVFSFDALQNPEPAERKAIITLSYTDPYDRTVSEDLEIMQAGKADYDLAVEKDFNYVKGKMAAGTLIDEDIFIKGVVVANGTSDNFPKNRYIIQNEENKAIVFESDELIPFNRYDVLHLWLKDCTVKEYHEGSFTYKVLSSVSSSRIIEQIEGEPFTVKEMHMKDLTDDYLFSLVKLKDVEFAIPFGGLTNFNEGYNNATYKQYLRYFPQCIRDIYGNNMYVLTNLEVGYRRESLPKGSGSITGIVVREYNTNFGGDLGKYAIRHLEKTDMAFATNRSEGFSNVLVEWDCLKPIGMLDGATFVAPTAGLSTATLFKKGASGFYSSSGAGRIYFVTDYRGDIFDNSQAQLADAAYNVGEWATTNEWWIIKDISTVGVSKSLSLQIETNVSTNNGPRDMIVEWSLDETSWTAVENGEFTCQGQIATSGVTGTVTYPRLIPGFKIYDFLLPNDLLGKSNIYLRLRCTSNVRADEDSRYGVTGTHRLAHVSIKYNK